MMLNNGKTIIIYEISIKIDLFRENQCDEDKKVYKPKYISACDCYVFKTVNVMTKF